jgi:alpha-tubulin suppressor-like RCC1 family protein
MLQLTVTHSTNGGVHHWGRTFATAPTLNNATAIASGTNFHLALRSNGAVVAWGTCAALALALS